jgi:dihydrofolate reductase
MGSVISDLSISLDGFIAGPNVGLENPLGDGGERIHAWKFSLASWREPQGMRGGKTNPDSELLEEDSARIGAFVMGRRMFDTGEVPWGDEPPFRKPVFVVTHRARAVLTREGGTTFTFVTDGLESALAQARAAAGVGDVSIAGGANIVQQAISAGLLDELQIHLAPVLLGEGTRLFEGLDARTVELDRVIGSPSVAHLKFRLASSGTAPT